ncbi:hypothetical protein N665_0151s0034 [Sinapis alba]|nr:hypothetical protein N665_0151s0034 [Sinapis alba]
MVNPWFPSGSAPVFIPSLATVGDSQDPVPPLPPDPPDPFPLTSYPPLSSPSPKPSRHLLASSSSSSSVVLAPGSSSYVSTGELAVTTPSSPIPQTGSVITVHDCRPKSTVARPLAAENLLVIPPKSTSPIQTNSASCPLLPLPSQTLTPVLPSHNPPSPTHPASNRFATNPPQINQPHLASSSLVERLRKSHDKTLSRLAPVSTSDSGTPRVLIPDSVFHKGAELHKDFITCQFNGRPPSFNQIQSVLNHMWGKGKRVEIHNNPLSRSMLVRIPSDYLRQIILEKNIWYVGDSMFHASQWSSSSVDSGKDEAIQIWAHLTGVPLDLRYQSGFSLVAGLIGEQKETDDFTLNLVSLTLSHVKVEVKLSEPLPRVVEFIRQSGEIVEVQVDYPWKTPLKFQKQAAKVTKSGASVPQYVPKVASSQSLLPANTSSPACVQSVPATLSSPSVPAPLVSITVPPQTSSINPLPPSSAPPLPLEIAPSHNSLRL